MVNLMLLDWSGAEREVHFVGWTDNTRTAFFIRGEQGVRRAITLRLPGLPYVTFHESPIPNLPVTQISRTVLRVPPCFSSNEEAEASRDRHLAEYFNAKHGLGTQWKLFTSQTLYLEPSDGVELARLLDEEKQRRRQDYLELERQTATLPMQQAEREHASLPNRFNTFDSDGNVISVFDVTLEMEKQHNTLGVRDRYLIAFWAAKFGFDLNRMNEDAQSFRRWLQQGATNRLARITDSTTGTVRLAECLNLTHDQWAVLEAAVHYEIRFADGSRCWLDNFEERDLHTPEEVWEFNELEAARKPPEPPPWHSEGFGTIWRRNTEGGVADSLPLSNEFRALCQLLAERDDKTAPFSEIEPRIGTRANELDISAGVNRPAQKGQRRIRDMLRTETGRLLLRWGVLAILDPAGREKFLKLSPPNPTS